MTRQASSMAAIPPRMDKCLSTANRNSFHQLRNRALRLAEHSLQQLEIQRSRSANSYRWGRAFD